MTAFSRFRPTPARRPAFPLSPIWAESLAAWATGRRIDRLAMIWPYDAISGGVSGVMPLPDGEIGGVVDGGYTMVAAVGGHAPYTHVLSAGRQDYLASFAPPPAATVAAERAALDAARFDRDAEHGWEADGGAGRTGSR